VTTEIGCPYCIVGGFSFRKMIKNSHGAYACPTCGHIDHPRMECECDRCEQIRFREDSLPGSDRKQDRTGIWDAPMSSTL
jgi:hypothetical protein